jgi:hypothetical protein
MDEETFFSRKFVLTCPVWLIVKLEAWGKGNETADALQLFLGKPCLGPFLPIFLSPKTANDVAKETKLKGSGAVEIATADQLCRVLKLLPKILPIASNAVVYFKKDQTRFYRIDDLYEELQGYRNN